MVSARTMFPRDLDILLCSKSSQPMSHHTLGQRQTRGHEEGRPIDAVEADDLLAYQLQVGGPEAREALLVFGGVAAVAEGGDVVGQRIHPHINHMLFITRHRDAPVEAGAADRTDLSIRRAQRRSLHYAWPRGG